MASKLKKKRENIPIVKNKIDPKSECFQEIEVAISKTKLGIRCITKPKKLSIESRAKRLINNKTEIEKIRINQ